MKTNSERITELENLVQTQQSQIDSMRCDPSPDKGTLGNASTRNRVPKDIEQLIESMRSDYIKGTFNEEYFSALIELSSSSMNHARVQSTDSFERLNLAMKNVAKFH